MPKKLLSVIFLCFTVLRTYGADPKIAAYIGADFNPEFNRVFQYNWTVAYYGGLKINDKTAIDGGVSFGRLGDDFSFNARAAGSYLLDFGWPVNFRVNTAYLYNAIPDYKTDTHSIIPYFSVIWKWLDLSLGASLRFTSFDRAYLVFEPIFVFNLCFRAIDKERFLLDIRFSNIDEFISRNMNNFSLSADTLLLLKDNVFLKNELEIFNTGNGGLSATFYGISYKGGVILRF